MIELSRLLELEGCTEQFTFVPEMKEFSTKMGTFPVAEKSAVQLTITNRGKKVLLIEAKGEIVLEIPCDRCLQPAAVTFPIDFAEETDMKMTDEERREALEERSYICGTCLDEEKLLHSELLLRWPDRVLCREDCKGICPVCGKNRNLAPCDCETFVPDPRMAGIADLFRNFQQEKK